MTTLQNFTDLLTKANIRFEVNQIEHLSTQIGITYGKGVWHWFEIYESRNFQCQLLSMTHSYSQNNGKTEKGLRWRMNFEESLCKKLDIKYLSDLNIYSNILHKGSELSDSMRSKIKFNGALTIGGDEWINKHSFWFKGSELSTDEGHIYPVLNSTK